MSDEIQPFTSDAHFFHGQDDFRPFLARMYFLENAIFYY